MPRIFDNIENELLPALRDTLDISDHASFCEAWKHTDVLVDRRPGGSEQCCRLSSACGQPPPEELPAVLSIAERNGSKDNSTATHVKKHMAEGFWELHGVSDER